jgi:cell division transport system permease protein
MLGALGLLIINANKLSKHFKENIGFQVYLKDTATSVQTDALIQELSNSKFTKQVLFISKEKAAQKLKTDLGEDFVSFLGSNPLLNSIELKIEERYANIDTLLIIEKQILQNNFVKEVVYQKDMINNLNKNTKAVAFFILIFSIALLIVAIALICLPPPLEPLFFLRLKLPHFPCLPPYQLGLTITCSNPRLRPTDH